MSRYLRHGPSGILQENLPEQVTSLLSESERLQRCCEDHRKEIKYLRDQNEYAEMDKELPQNLLLEYEQKLEHKDSEIMGLHVHIDTWKTDCDLVRESLAKAGQDADALQQRIAALEKENQLLKVEVEQRKRQLHKIIPLLHDKVRVARVCRTTLLAVAQVARTAQDQDKIKSLYIKTYNAIPPKFTENETRGLLKEAGIDVPDDASEASVQTAAQTPGKEDYQDQQAEGAKRKRLE